VETLNARRPEGMDPVHLTVSLIPANDSGDVRSRQDCYTFRISGSARPGTHWNPYVDRMRALGIWANNKENGIPQIYKEASEEVRSALLAGFMDTDGCAINSRTAYSVSQAVRYRQLLTDMREIALRLGIKATRLRYYDAPDPANPQRMLPQVGIGLFEPNLAKLQAHSSLTRKRLRATWIDSELLALLIEDGPVPFELLPMEGAMAKTMPLHPQWLGWWFGDGNHDAPTIASAAQDHEKEIAGVRQSSERREAGWEGPCTSGSHFRPCE
jgi:hypothetical protein